MTIGLRRELGLLFGSLLAFFFAFGMLLPTLPLYIVDLGGGPVEIGIVVGVFSLGVLVVRPFVGRAVDTRGRRPLLVLGSVVAAVMAPLYLWLTAFAWMAAVRIVHGIGLSAFTGASNTLAADLAPPERRTEILGYMSTASVVAFALGPLLGIAIAERWGYEALFLTIGAFSLAAAGCGARLHRSPRREPGSSTYRAVILRRSVLVPTATLLLVTTAHGGAFAFMPILLEERLAFNFGLYFLVFSVASLGVRLIAGRLARRLGDGPLVWGGLVLYAAGLGLLPFVRGAVTMSLSAVLLGVGFSTYWPASNAMIANVSSDRTRGMVYSVFLGAFDLGMSLGGLVAGPVVAAVGIPALLGGLAAVPIAAAAVFVAGLGWRPATCPVAPVGVTAPP